MRKIFSDMNILTMAEVDKKMSDGSVEPALSLVLEDVTGYNISIVIPLSELEKSVKLLKERVG